MIWSLTKILVFVLLTAALSWLLSLLVDLNQDIRIVFLNREFILAPVTAVVAILLLIPLVWLLLQLVSFTVAVLRFVSGDETALTRFFARNRSRRGLAALADGMIALAAGEPKTALAKAKRAAKGLPDNEMTSLLAVQAAVQLGDRKQANTAYRNMLENDKTRFVGLRGILKQKLEDGDNETALKLAEKAFALRPRHEEIQDILLRLQCEAGDWPGARTTLSAKVKARKLPRDVFRRRHAVLMLAEAERMILSGQREDGNKVALKANRELPDSVPAAVLAARIQADRGSKRTAVRIIRKAWDIEPHPDLAAAFASFEPDEAPEQRVQRFRKLLARHPDHPESKMVKAELLLAAEDFPGARNAMGDLAVEKPTVRALAIMAAIERGEGAEDNIVRGWLARALGASRGPQWVCDACRARYPVWLPVCKDCSALDSISWKEVSNVKKVHSSSLGILPLILPLESEEVNEPQASDADADVNPANQGEDTGQTAER